MASAPPVPKPRTNIDTVNKKPIPKPRQKGLAGVTVSIPSSVESDEICSKCNSVKCEECECNRSVASKDSGGKNKVANEGKRIVGTRLEKSMRSITRRLTARPISPNKGGILQTKYHRSQSLPSDDVFQNTPAEDIFKTISFKSPITGKKESEFPQPAGENEIEDVDEYQTYNAPPPVYPPPPLPDESTYDEVHSVAHSASSASSSSGGTVSNQIVSGAHYEPIAIDNVKELPGKPMIVSKFRISDNQPPVQIDRSDSWSFYGTIFGDARANDDTTSLSVDASTKDSLSVVSGVSCGRNSVSPSLLSELDALGCISEDEDFDTFGDDQSSLSSLPRSASVRNEMYDNWGPLKVAEPVILRNRETDRKFPSKSVILEFDPLFTAAKTNISGNSQATTTSSNPLANNTSLYGNIKVMEHKRVGHKRNSYDEVAIECPPVPPRRQDSVSNSTKSVIHCSVESEENDVSDIASGSGTRPLQREKQDSSGPSVMFHSDSVLYKTVSFEDVSEDKGKQKMRLPRLQSMRRAVKAVADSTSNWSPNIIRRGVRLGLPVRDQRRSGQVFPERLNSGDNNCEMSVNSVVIERPEILPQLCYPHCGLLYKIGIGKERAQDHVQRWCVLAEDKLTFYADRSASAIKEVIALNSILSIQVIMDHKINVDGDSFEIIVPQKSGLYVFGTSGLSERRVWMQKIIESLTSSFPLRVISDFSRCGWCYLKEGISGKWSSAWILSHQRLFFYRLPKMTLQEVDLRKARCVALQDSDDVCSLQVTMKGPTILVDCQGLTLYFCMDTPDETKSWRKTIHDAAVRNGPNLDQQQLTKDDVPVIVDKCIKFVFAHGSMSEGIYRRSGANTSVTRLLSAFWSDAWSVQLSRQDYTEYDVSSVLKRFFRDLPEPLLTTELHGQFCDIAAGKFKESRIALYRRALEQLPPVNFLTTRKLIAHLHSIHEQREKNRMPVENLAAIWGPTLMHIESSESLEWSKLETGVVAELITHHVQLFEVDSEELKREKQMAEVLERINLSITNQPQGKQSGELLVWIYLVNRDSGNCVHITVGPQKLAGEVCIDLAKKINVPSHELVLQEVVCNGQMIRFLHHTEKVLDTILRWSYWDECDRKDNCLILMKNEALKEVVPLTKQPLVMSGELRFADRKSKSFKPFVFEFSRATLCYYKDKKGSVKMHEWKIEDIVWYLGYETKRNPQTRWAITFIDKNDPNKRSKESPYFGNTIAGTSKDEQLRWMAALLVGEFPQGLLASPILLT